MTIVFDQEFPNNFRVHTEKLIRKYQLLLPIWVQEVFVQWRRDEEEIDAFASMCVQNEYRRVTFRISASLIEKPMLFQEETMLHEIMHAFNQPLYEEAMFLLQSRFPDGEKCEDPAVKELYELWEERFRRVTERINSDFSFAVPRYTKHLLEQAKGE